MKTNEVKITKQQLIEMLADWSFGAQPVSIQYVTEPKLTKEGKNRFGSVTKIANVGGMVGYCYENSVNNAREKEELERNFMAQKLWGGKGQRISLALTKHIEKGTFYMTYKAQQTFKSFHFDSVLNFIPYTMLKPFLTGSKPTNQGVSEENQVHHREISIDNIRKFKVRKVTYIVV